MSRRPAESIQRTFVLASIVFVLLASGCTGADSEVTTVRFWHSFVATTRPALDALIERFEEEHPGIRVNAQYVPTGDGLVHKLVSAVQSGTAPDVSWVHADFLGRLVQADAIYPMHHFLEGEDGLTREELDDFLPGLLRTAEWQDTLYGLPMEATLLALVYNRDHFREAGLDPDRPPATWDELRTYTERLTRDVDGDGKVDRHGFYVPVFSASGPLNIWMNLQWSTFLWQAGGYVIDEDQRQVLYGSEAGARALAFWKDLYYMMDKPGNSITYDLSFVSGSVSMIMDGPWDLPRFRKIENFDWDIAPLPAGPKGEATYLAGEHMAIFRQSRHPDAAWTFVKWVIQPENQAFFSKESGYLPVRQSTLELRAYQEALAEDDRLRAFVELIPTARTRRPIDFHHVEINRHIAEAIERSLIADEEPARVLREAASRSNALLAGEQADGRTITHGSTPSTR